MIICTINIISSVCIVLYMYQCFFNVIASLYVSLYCVCVSCVSVSLHLFVYKYV